MKALSIKQPWLYCITDLDKRIENRTWRPPELIIGQRIALHASKRPDTRVGQAEAARLAGLTKKAPALPMGSVVATAIVLGWIRSFYEFSDVALWKRYSGDKWHITGQIGWVLADVVKLPQPVPYKGKLGLWKFPDELLTVEEAR